MYNIYENISENLVKLRKGKNLTQAEFANIIKYSDKSVSKWETGMSIPSVETLYEIANFYGITVDDLIKSEIDNKAISESESIRRSSRIVICLLSITFVWLIATLIYVLHFINYDGERLWKVFIWAIPAMFLVLIFYSAFWKVRYTYIVSSFFMWTLITALFVQLHEPQYYLLFILGAPIQVIIILFKSLRTDTIEVIKAKLDAQKRKIEEKITIKKEIKNLKKDEKSK